MPAILGGSELGDIAVGSYAWDPMGKPAKPAYNTQILKINQNHHNQKPAKAGEQIKIIRNKSGKGVIMVIYNPETGVYTLVYTKIEISVSLDITRSVFTSVEIYREDGTPLAIYQDGKWEVGSMTPVVEGLLRQAAYALNEQEGTDIDTSNIYVI